MNNLTAGEKFKAYAASWLAAEEHSFCTPQIAAQYRNRVKRLLEVLSLKEPDRVPVLFNGEEYILEHAEFIPKDLFYNPDRVLAATLKIHQDFDLEYQIPGFCYSGHVLDILGMHLIRWPGSSTPGLALPDDTIYQYVEDEYMRADEYDELIENPEGYILRKYLPRICTKLSGLSEMPNLFNMIEVPGFVGTLSSLATGTKLRQTVDRLLEAADHAGEISARIGDIARTITRTMGTPSFYGSITFAPCDMIGDTMRCTLGLMKDLYRYPDKVLAAAEALVPMAIQMAVQGIRKGDSPIVVIPLHKGSDIFLSPEQFDTFYWPSLKALMLGLINAGCIPAPFAEGSFNKRLDAIAKDPLPPGQSLWIFDQTDMGMAKEKIGDWACIGGNVPASLFKQGNCDMLEAYCRELIETCGSGGGFCLSPGAVITQANPKNVRTFLNCGKKFGRYKS